jgi:hypothetical protein
MSASPAMVTSEKPCRLQIDASWGTATIVMPPAPERALRRYVFWTAFYAESATANFHFSTPILPPAASTAPARLSGREYDTLRAAARFGAARLTDSA